MIGYLLKYSHHIMEKNDFLIVEKHPQEKLGFKDCAYINYVVL